MGRLRHVVLCVDDDPQVLSALRRILCHEPYDLLTTHRPEQALRWVDTREISLVISDQRMPEMIGTDLLEQVRRRSPATAGLLLTAYPEATAAVPGLRQHADVLISKPWDGPMLRRTIRELLGDQEASEADEAASRPDRSQPAGPGTR